MWYLIIEQIEGTERFECAAIWGATPGDALREYAAINSVMDVSMLAAYEVKRDGVFVKVEYTPDDTPQAPHGWDSVTT